MQELEENQISGGQTNSGRRLWGLERDISELRSGGGDAPEHATGNVSGNIQGLRRSQDRVGNEGLQGRRQEVRGQESEGAEEVRGPDHYAHNTTVTRVGRALARQVVRILRILCSSGCPRELVDQTCYNDLQCSYSIVQ